MECVMTRRKTVVAQASAPRKIHVAFSGGGARAVAADVGALLACEMAEVQIESIGGVSGGMFTALKYAKTRSAVACLRHMLEMDFGTLIEKRNVNWVKVLLEIAHLRYKKNARRVGNAWSRLTWKSEWMQVLRQIAKELEEDKSRPLKGVFSLDKLGAYAEQDTKVWPDGFWVSSAASSSKMQDADLYFTKQGVFLSGPDGVLRIISVRPASLSVAARSTSAIPGFMEAVKYKVFNLYDGALGVEGRCPINIPVRLFGAKPADILAIDVGPDNGRQRMKALWRFVCGDHCVPDTETPPLFQREGLPVMHVTPRANYFTTLQFDITVDEKWLAVMASFQETVKVLAKNEILAGEKLRNANALLRVYNRRILACKKKRKEGDFAAAVQQLMSHYGLF